VFVCFVRISEQTAIISLYSINWLVFVTEMECLLRGKDWIFITFRWAANARVCVCGGGGLHVIANCNQRHLTPTLCVDMYAISIYSNFPCEMRVLLSPARKRAGRVSKTKQKSLLPTKLRTKYHCDASAACEVSPNLLHFVALRHCNCFK
jgi:hypothetical protein